MDDINTVVAEPIAAASSDCSTAAGQLHRIRSGSIASVRRRDEILGPPVGSACTGKSAGSLRMAGTGLSEVNRRAEAAVSFDHYVAWYSWAVATLGGDPLVCHTAAAAARQGLAEGRDRTSADAAARSAAASETALRETRAGYGAHYAYVGWFIWVRASLGLPNVGCHEATRAAPQAMTAGGGQQSAIEAAFVWCRPVPVRT
jgi:hypothetical protein